MAHSLDDVACAGLSLSADHGGALRHSAQSLSKVPASTNKWDFVVVLVDVVDLICWCEDLQRIFLSG